MENNNEKYVSIEYNKWETYYKPLEEDNIKLKRSLEESEANKIYKIYTDVSLYNHRYNNVYYCTLQLLPNRTIITKEINDEIIAVMVEKITHRINFRNGNHSILTQEKVKQALYDIEKDKETLKKFSTEFMQWYDTLPKFIKWLFKLKNKK